MAIVGEQYAEEFEITSHLHQGFIALFGDRHPVHTNPEYAMRRGFRSEVMHGNILNGFLSYFVGERIADRDVMIVSQEIKFHRPFYVGDRLRLEAQVKAVHDSVGMIEYGCKFRNTSDRSLIASAKICLHVTTEKR
jgi:3-hydroxybutyryl-CoA dehydratase